MKNFEMYTGKSPKQISYFYVVQYVIDTFRIMKVQILILIYFCNCIFLISGHELIYERQFRTQSQSLFNDDYDKHTAPPKLIEGKINILFEHSEVIQIKCLSSTPIRKFLKIPSSNTNSKIEFNFAAIKKNTSRYKIWQH